MIYISHMACFFVEHKKLVDDYVASFRKCFCPYMSINSQIETYSANWKSFFPEIPTFY